MAPLPLRTAVICSLGVALTAAGGVFAADDTAQAMCQRVAEQLATAASGSLERIEAERTFTRTCIPLRCNDLQKRIARQSYTAADLREYESSCRGLRAPANDATCAASLRVLLHVDRAGATTLQQQRDAFAASCPAWTVPPAARFVDDTLADAHLYAHPFTDLAPGDPLHDAAVELFRRGIISGGSDGSLRPYDGVTRAEALKMALVGCGVPTDPLGTEPFMDVSASDWFSDYVRTGVRAGVVRTSTAGRQLFRPHAGVNRAEFYALLSRACLVPDLAPPRFADVSGEEWFAPSAGNAQFMGLLDARLPFSPAGAVTRGDVLTALYSFFRYRDGLPPSCSATPPQTCVWRDTLGRLHLSQTTLGGDSTP